MKTLATVGALQALNDMETYHERGWFPSVNVKCHVWCDAIPWEALRAEFGDHVDVVEDWASSLHNAGQYDQLDAAVEIARECWWDDAKEMAVDHFGSRVNVYSAGRSGGHLIVMGLGEPNDWTVDTCPHIEAREDACYDWDCEGFTLPDVDLVSQWLDYQREIERIRDDFPHQVGWHLIVNVHDRIHEAIAHAI